MERSKKLSMDKAFLKKLTSAVFANLNNDQFSAKELAKEVGISQSQIFRNLQRLNGKSITQFIREIRLEEAHRYLSERIGTASEISYRVGFNSPTYFNKCFHEYFGYTPGEVKNQKNDIQEVLKYSKDEESRVISIRGRKSDFNGPLKMGNKPSRVKSNRLFYLIVGIVFILLAIILWQFLRFKDMRSAKIEKTDKSIAVLPFISLSDDPNQQYFADGVMEAILLHLSKIEDFRVMSRTSVEQYRRTDKTATIICRELDVEYLLEGSFEKHNSQARLIVKLIKPGREKDIWAEEYVRDWNDILVVESEVAQLVASQLHAVITPEEKRLIEKTPTLNLTALDFYLRGRGEYVKYELDIENRAALEKAEDQYYKALEYDSSFAQAYTGLGLVYKSKYFWKTFLSEDFLDSLLSLANIALSFDDQLAEAYVLRGDYYRFQNRKKRAIKEYDEAIKLNPNDWQAYWHEAEMYKYDNYVKTLYSYQKAASLQRGIILPKIYRGLAMAYAESGFKERSVDYIYKALKLDDDSVTHYRALGGLEETYSNFEKAIDYYKKSIRIDSTNWWTSLWLGRLYSYIGRHEEQLEYLQKYEERYKTDEETNPAWIFRIAHAYWVNGNTEQADSYFDKGLKYHEDLLELRRHQAQNMFIYRNLASIYAFRGDKEKAYKNLRRMNQSKRFPLFMIKDLKNDPLLSAMRDEPEFREILKDVEAKYLAEHERVKTWLEQNDML